MTTTTVVGHYDKVPQKIKDAVCYYLAMYPRLSNDEIARKVEYALIGIRPSEKLIEQVQEFEEDKIYILAQGGIEAVKLGITLRELPYATLHGRVVLLHEIINMGKNGFMKEVLAPRGEVVELREYDFKSALEATKQLSTLMERVEAATVEADDTILVDTYDYFTHKNPDPIY
mgnify:CR=1 FL=1